MLYDIFMIEHGSDYPYINYEVVLLLISVIINYML